MPNRDVETIRSRAKFVATLRRVADAIERQLPVRIQVAAKRFVVPAGATLSVEHEVEGRDEELELQLRWQNSGEDPVDSGRQGRPRRQNTREDPPPSAAGRRARARKAPARRKAVRTKR